MIKTVVFLPDERLLEAAQAMIRERKLTNVSVRAIRTMDAVNEARAAAERGAGLVVASGYQAKLIREYTRLPLVEIRLHTQELGMLLKRARAMARKERPHIGLAAPENLLCDLESIEELFDLRLSVVFLKQTDHISRALRELARLKPDVIMGGEAVCAEARQMGFPSLSLDITERSVAAALLEAERMAAASKLRETAAEEGGAQDALPDGGGSEGSVRVSPNGTVLSISSLIEGLIGRNNEEVVGLPLSGVFPELDSKAAARILRGEQKEYSACAELLGRSWLIRVTPVRYGAQITGANVDFKSVEEAFSAKDGLRFRKSRLIGYEAGASFEDIATEDEPMRRMLALAKRYAGSDAPVLIYGEEGTERQTVAEAIHNISLRRGGPFVRVDAKAIGQEGDNGRAGLLEALKKASGGTLFIKDVDRLSPSLQSGLIKLLTADGAVRADAQPLYSPGVRVMASSGVCLQNMVRDGFFHEELFYLLHGLTLQIPPLRRRPADLELYFERYLQECASRLKSALTPEEGALRELCSLDFHGNHIQLKAFCERLALTADGDRVDAAQIRELYEELYPEFPGPEREEPERIVVYQPPEATELNEVLEKYKGNRGMAAKELGISTTTLWRKMRKYGIEARYVNAEV